MAFTVITSWDFRGADSASVKRASRRGSYTLIQQGTPTYATTGVTCDTASAGLNLVLPSELKFTGDFWLMCRARRSASGAVSSTVFGYIPNDSDSTPFLTLAHVQMASGTNAKIAGSDNGTYVESAESTTAVPQSSFETYTLKSLGTSIKLFSEAVERYSVTVASRPAFYATSHFSLGAVINSTRDHKLEYEWAIIGTGDITTGEMSTIAASPNTYIYGAATTPFRAYGRYGVRGPVR